MTKNEALKLALEALEVCEQHGYIPVRLTRDSITALREALAEPEQCQCPNCKVTLHASDCAVHSGPAYPAGGCDCGAQQVVDSDEKAGAYMEARLWEFIDMAAAWPKASPDPRTWNHVVVYAPKPAQEPVATVTNESGNPDVTMSWWHEPALPVGTKFYTSPPAQRTWVGLTDEEIDKTHETEVWDARRSYARAIEAKLKEKNT